MLIYPNHTKAVVVMACCWIKFWDNQIKIICIRKFKGTLWPSLAQLICRKVWPKTLSFPLSRGNCISDYGEYLEYWHYLWIRDISIFGIAIDSYFNMANNQGIQNFKWRNYQGILYVSIGVIYNEIPLFG